MSDLSGLPGIFSDSLRYNAETGVLSVSKYNAEVGERELQEIEFGPSATFVWDLRTRERGWGLFRVNVYDVRLSPVGAKLPPQPDDPEFKVAVGMWVWHPVYGELRVEATSTLFRQAIVSIWDKANRSPEARAGRLPIVRFTHTVPAKFKAFPGKTFAAPVLEIVGYCDRDQIPGWSDRPATVALPSAPILLGPAAPALEAPAPSEAKEPGKAKGKGPTKDPDDPIDDVLGGDPIPYK